MLTPVFVFAQDLGNIVGLVEAIQDIVNVLIPVAFGLIVVAFFWGLAMYLLAGGDEEAKAKGKNLMIWGVVALFVAASIWGIVGFIGDALGLGSEGVDDFSGPNTQI